MQLYITFLTIIYIHIDLGPFQHTITLPNHTYNMYIYMNVSPLSRSFLGLFSSNSFSTSIFFHYTLRGLLPFVQFYSEVKIMIMRMISEDDQDDRGKYR